uniref:Uncharacterized protein n=1 Tax=Coccidioides posadasii RMSCC 3488 TaxID=454284 RepID=A0A0J6FJD4_COCPO|nr:hypothetical protein CPAG_05282 [Coccidioides posadasii RMSCC 3488]
MSLLPTSPESTSSPDQFCLSYNDDPDDTDENLSDVPLDFGGSVATKALRYCVVDCWKLESDIWQRSTVSECSFWHEKALLPTAGCQELELLLKQEMDKWYLFLKVVVMGGQICILRDTPMTLGLNLKITSEIHGWLNPFYTHQFWHGMGKLLDKSGFVSSAQMNVIMNHVLINTFIKHYQIQHHANLQEVMCGLDPDQEWEQVLIRQN